jgi:hypothetical protein
LHPDAAEFLLNNVTEAAGAAGKEVLKKGLALGLGALVAALGIFYLMNRKNRSKK